MVKQQAALLGTEGVTLHFTGASPLSRRRSVCTPCRAAPLHPWAACPLQPWPLARPPPAPASARPVLLHPSRLPTAPLPPPADAAIREIARVAEEVNTSVDNIGARRLHTILERIVEDISFDAPERVSQAACPAASPAAGGRLWLHPPAL